jgi:hypothetical protein
VNMRLGLVSQNIASQGLRGGFSELKCARVGTGLG